MTGEQVPTVGVLETIRGIPCRVIQGASGYYALVSGYLVSIKNGIRTLKPERRKCDGRARYTIMQDDGRRRRTYGSVFMLEAWVGPRPEGMEACHNNGNCRDDSLKNLRWDTTVGNKADMVAHGTRLRGENINTAKLTEADVREIRRIGPPLRQHAERHHVTEALICAILKRKVWKHVE